MNREMLGNLKDFLERYTQLVAETKFSISEDGVFDDKGFYYGVLEENHDSFDVVYEEEVICSVKKDTN